MGNGKTVRLRESLNTVFVWKTNRTGFLKAVRNWSCPLKRVSANGASTVAQFFAFIYGLSFSSVPFEPLLLHVSFVSYFSIVRTRTYSHFNGDVTVNLYPSPIMIFHRPK